MQVFDGHSGAGAAEFARDHLHDYFANELQPDSLEPSEMQKALVCCSYSTCCLPSCLHRAACTGLLVQPYVKCYLHPARHMLHLCKHR